MLSVPPLSFSGLRGPSVDLNQSHIQSCDHCWLDTATCEFPGQLQTSRALRGKVHGDSCETGVRER